MSMIEFQFGYGELERKLKALNSIRLEAVTKKQAVQMYNRAGHIGPAGGGTPFDTGELMESRFYKPNEFGYTKEYAPHVEEGHRTRNGGFFRLLPNTKAARVHSLAHNQRFLIRLPQSAL